MKLSVDIAQLKPLHFYKLNLKQKRRRDNVCVEPSFYSLIFETKCYRRRRCVGVLHQRIPAVKPICKERPGSEVARTPTLEHGKRIRFPSKASEHHQRIMEQTREPTRHNSVLQLRL